MNGLKSVLRQNSKVILGQPLNLHDGWTSPFLGYLWMCFFFMSGAVWQLQRTIDDLQTQIKELKKPASSQLS